MAGVKYCLGLMSGTSVDSIDASLIAIGKKADKLLLHTQHEFPKKLREDILEIIRTPSAPLDSFTKLHYEIGSAFADAAVKAIAEAKKRKLCAKGPDLIGSHGQTVFHDPIGKRTLQIGEASIIAARTGITTVADFRAADTAVGGEGAPLLPYYHRRLFEGQSKQGIAIHNLGGISNYTYIGPKKKLFALDTGPANCLLDGAIQIFSGGEKSFDENGALASTGRLSPEMLRYLLEQRDIAAFRKLRAPKSTGRELFSPRVLETAMKEYSHLAAEDVLATLAHFTVELIADSYEAEIMKRKLPLRTVVVAGGGARNSFLLSLLGTRFPKVKFQTMEDYGHSAQALESQAFAYYAFLAYTGATITFPTTTGAKAPMICGKISPGKNWLNLQR
ncbi:MAG: anhydro-N-acetylmuramic acid kinase [Bdellovibrionota bacterium]